MEKEIFRPLLTFEIEPTIRCNASCIMCPREKTPKKPDMDISTFKTAAEKIGAYGKNQPLTMIHLCGLGEPTLNKDLVDFIEIATQNNLLVSMQTNAKALDRNLSRELLQAGLSGFFISVPGNTKESYEKILRGCNFENFKQNVHSLLDERDNAGLTDDVLIGMSLAPTRTTKVQIPSIVNYWKPYGVDYFFAEESVVSRGGSFTPVQDTESEFDVLSLQDQIKSAGEFNLDSWNAFVFATLTKEEYYRFVNENKFYCFLKDKLYFLGCDGNFYLGSCDFEKIFPIGHVNELTIDQLIEKKSKMDKVELCHKCPDYSSLYGLSFEEIIPLIETQSDSKELLGRSFEVAHRRGILNLNGVPKL